MALYWLINNLTYKGNQLFAGTSLNSASDDTVGIAAAGGLLHPQGDAIVDTAAAQALVLRQRGGRPAEMAELMQSAFDSLLGSTATGAGASEIGVRDAGNLYAGTDVEACLAEAMTQANAALALAGANIAVVKRTVTIDFTADGFGALGAGVKTFSKNIGAALPANSRLVGWDIGETITQFDDAAHGNYGLELGTAGTPALIMASESVKAGATGFPKAGTAGVQGYAMAPHGTEQLVAKLTSSVDLNTVTAGSIVVNVFYIVLA